MSTRPNGPRFYGSNRNLVDWSRGQRSKRTEYRGQWYASKMEAARAANLDLALKAGLITGWRRGESVTIVDDGPGRRVYYTPDFLVADRTTQWAEDVKGRAPQGFRVKAILFEVKTGLKLRVVDERGRVVWTIERKKAKS